MKSPSIKRDLAKELIFDVQEIEDSADRYRRGRDSAYQTVAIQLRNILLKGRRSLLGTVFPDVKLHAFRPSNAPQDLLDAFPPLGGRVVELLDVGGFMSLSTARPGLNVTIETLPEPSLSITQWLEQWIIRPDVKVGSLVREIADEEVAHTQAEYGPTVSKTIAWTFAGAADGRELRHAVIVAIGDYVADRIRNLIRDKASIEGLQEVSG